MIVSPSYSARILGEPDVPVSIRDDAGTITLDSGVAPHVEGTDIVLALPDAGLLDDLDPRDNRRLVIEAGERVFDLGIREAHPNRSDGTVTVRLASDEALLDDFAQLVDDGGPRAHETSLRAVCDYVLGKIGAHLEPGDEDADVTAFWRVSNLVSNPSFEADMVGWALGANANSLTRNGAVTPSPVSGAWVARWVATAAGWSSIDYTNVHVSAGRSHVLSAWMYTNASVNACVMVRFKNAVGQTIGEVYGPYTLLAVDQWTRVSLVGVTAPAGTAQASLHMMMQADTAGRPVRLDGVMFHEGVELVDYFDGSMPGTPTYDYEWSGAPHASTSIRVPIIDRPPESLVWSAGTSALAFLRPIVQAAGFRLVCNERREWTLRDEHHRESGGLTYRYGVNLIDAEESLDRSADDWYDGAVFAYTWTDRDGIEQTRLDAFALSATPAKVIRREINAPYPGPGRAEYAARRAQGKGRTVTVTTQATWDEAAEQPLTVALEGTPIQTGISNRVVFDLSRNEVTVTSRTTDTPAAAWILVPVGERWIDSPAGESWTEEVI